MATQKPKTSLLSMAPQNRSGKTSQMGLESMDFMDYQASAIFASDSHPSQGSEWSHIPDGLSHAVLSPIETAIPDIMLMVLEYLSPVDIAALALTSHSLFQSHWPTSRLRTRNRQQLLLRLEKDLPKMYYCHGCVKLHPWDPSWYDMYRDDESYLSDKYTWDMRHCSGTAPFTIPGRYALPYHFARPIMNRHRYGPEHGPPVSVLSRTTQSAGKISLNYGDISRGIVETNQHTAEIKDGELILYSKVTLYERDKDTFKMLKYLNHIGFSVCQHLATRLADQSETMYNFNAAGPPEFFATSPPVTRACYKCMTDYIIHVEKTHTEGWIVTILSWQTMGKVLSPLTWDWRHMTTVDREFVTGCIEPRFREALEDHNCNPGVVACKYYSIPTAGRLAPGVFSPVRGMEYLELLLEYYGRIPRSLIRRDIDQFVPPQDE